MLHSFTGSDGANPFAGLVADSNGNLYGTTLVGGVPGPGTACSSIGCGVVFKLSPGGTETVLHSFMGSDGAAPEAGLANSNGNFYGTTEGGGAFNGAWCSNSRRAGPIQCCTPFGAATGLIP